MIEEGVSRFQYSNACVMWLREFKDAFGCVNPACKDQRCELELDHVAKTTKSFETSREILKGCARKKYILELLKQQVLCKNKCHNKKTIVENMLPK